MKGGEKLKIGKKITEKELNGENVQSCCCIISNLSKHNCTKFCTIVAEGSLGRKLVDKLLVKEVENNATVLKRGISRAAGYDLSSAEGVVIPGKSKVVARIGLAISIPVDSHTRIAPHSGFAVKQFIDASDVP